MEREGNQIQDHQILPTKLDQSPRKPGGGGRIGGGDRLKRDEWSEGAVTSLLEAYEAKWVLRNRAKLKGQDWEDVSKHVSSRANSTKSPKTQTQCKNKIESMKKRYRSESATNDMSSWTLFPRLDHLLRGTGNGGSRGPLPMPPQHPLPDVHPPELKLVSNPGLVLVESPPVATPLPPPPPPPPSPSPPPQPAVEFAHNSHESNGVDRMAKDAEGVQTVKLSDQVSDKTHHDHLETDSSTPALYSNNYDDNHNDKQKLKKMKQRKRKRKRRRRGEESSSYEDIADSIRWLAEAVVRSEQARMDTMREVERMRVEAEAKRGELDLKRTEIIANTQLEIARIFASTPHKTVDSSLRMGRST